MAAIPLSLLLLCLLSFGQCQARVVAVVFDDSSSMQAGMKSVYARYALQLLLSVLDQRHDRLFIRRLSKNQSEGGGIRREPGLSPAERRAWFERIARRWLFLSDTPYYAIDGAINDIIEETRPNEDASLLILTDGHIEPESTLPPGGEPALEKRYREARRLFRGRSLRAFFVVLSPTARDRRIIAEQGVRHALLTTFNGNPRNGAVVIDRDASFYKRLRDVVTRVLGGNPRPGRAIRFGARDIEVTPPFSVSGLTVVVPGDHAPPPSLTGESFALAGSNRLYRPWQTDRLNAEVYHITPLNGLYPLLPEKLSFSAQFPHPDRAYIFFRSRLRADRTLWVAGRRLDPDANGTYVVDAGQRIVLHAFLIDDLHGAHKRVDFNKLPDEPQFNVDYLTPGQTGFVAKPMALNKAASDAIYNLVFDQPGHYQIAVEARYPGFFDRRAADVQIKVVTKPQARVALRFDLVKPCGTCASGVVPVRHSPNPGALDLARLTPRLDAPTGGQFMVTLGRPLPSGIVLVLPGGGVIDGRTRPSGSIRLAPGDNPSLILRRTGAFEAPQPETATLRLDALAADGFTAKSAIALTIAPKISRLVLRPAGSTLDPTGKKPFRIAVTSLRADEGVFVAFDGLEGALHLNDARVQGSGWGPFTLHPGSTPTMLLVSPQTSWLGACCTSTGPRRFTLTYRDPATGQQASLPGTVKIVDVGPLVKCLWQIIAIGVAILFLLYLWRLLTTSRFPRGSALVINGRDIVPRERRLDRWWCRLLPLRDERGTVEGFHVQARAGGGVLLLSDCYPGTVRYQGRTLEQHFADNGARAIPIGWNAVLTEPHGRHEIIYVFVRDRKKRRPERTIQGGSHAGIQHR